MLLMLAHFSSIFNLAAWSALSLLPATSPYTKFAARYVPTSHSHPRAASPKVTKRVDPRTIVATPVQKRQKITAVNRASAMVPSTKEANRRMGMRESSSWATMKDCVELAGQQGAARKQGGWGEGSQMRTNKSGCSWAKTRTLS